MSHPGYNRYRPKRSMGPKIPAWRKAAIRSGWQYCTTHNERWNTGGPCPQCNIKEADR